MKRTGKKNIEEYLPGETGIWVFVIGDLIMFTGLFVVFMYYRALDLAVFTSEHNQLSQLAGLVNTGLMITSSWVVAGAVKEVRQGSLQIALIKLKIAFVCSISFGVVKIFEWYSEVLKGNNPASSDFFMFYFILTGMHLIHVIIGTGALFYGYRITSSQGSGGSIQRDFESTALFWHLVDVIWIILFCLLYLVK